MLVAGSFASYMTVEYMEKRRFITLHPERWMQVGSGLWECEGAISESTYTFNN